MREAVCGIPEYPRALEVDGDGVGVGRGQGKPQVLLLLHSWDGEKALSLLF